MGEPKTLKEARKKIYDKWYGNEKGSPYTEGKCAYAVYEPLSRHFYQCTRRNGKGINGLYCGIHAKKVSV